MGLSLGVRTGSRILVGENDMITVKSFSFPTFILSLNGKKDVLITDQYSTEVLPDVKAFTGPKIRSASGKGACARLVFEAPRNIKIKLIRNEEEDRRNELQSQSKESNGSGEHRVRRNGGHDR
jgi:hypothetical protein